MDEVQSGWAIHEILRWKNRFIPSNLVHIHGDKDRIIPIKSLKPSFVIKGAGHFMTVTHAGEVEKLLREILI
ncbi:alpha/beta hydrolase [Sphingobacterium sp. 2149]|uniref:alpha/beta fold hydrolase n=1 Tax=Sphingobacterium sp. 2149 TaxID=2817763 RepID=UPI002856037A|nr:alpha/beta hydrolase [Sphingobacterium sp. 2149]MDR6737034.1 pimeloyl-ACP methyl ester carboxylesterase [Sphingobacterium sp. 2149]